MTDLVAAPPRTIHRSKYVELIAALGFDPSTTQEITLGLDTITAVVKVKDENGQDVPIDSGNPKRGIVKQSVCIYVVP